MIRIRDRVDAMIRFRVEVMDTVRDQVLHVRVSLRLLIGLGLMLRNRFRVEILDRVRVSLMLWMGS